MKVAHALTRQSLLSSPTRPVQEIQILYHKETTTPETTAKPREAERVFAEGDTCDLEHLVWMLFVQQGQIPEFRASLRPQTSNVLIN